MGKDRIAECRTTQHSRNQISAPCPIQLRASCAYFLSQHLSVDPSNWTERFSDRKMNSVAAKGFKTIETRTPVMAIASLRTRLGGLLMGWLVELNFGIDLGQRHLAID